MHTHNPAQYSLSCNCCFCKHSMQLILFTYNMFNRQIGRLLLQSSHRKRNMLSLSVQHIQPLSQYFCQGIILISTVRFLDEGTGCTPPAPQALCPSGVQIDCSMKSDHSCNYIWMSSSSMSFFGNIKLTSWVNHYLLKNYVNNHNHQVRIEIFDIM